MNLTAILATDSTGAIGAGGGLPWPRLPRDMRRFREATMGKVCLVGRRTYDTLPTLKGRRLVILTRRLAGVPTLPDPGKLVAGKVRTLDDALACVVAEGDDEALVIGGAEVYRATWPRIDRILLTVVDGTHPADTYLDPPGVLCEGFTCLSSQRHDPDADNPLGVVFSEWVRRV